MRRNLRLAVVLAGFLLMPLALHPDRAGAGFAPAVDYQVGTQPYSVAIGNLSGDAIPDLAVANGLTNNISVLLGTGSGAFGAASNFPSGLSPRSVATGNFNGDSFTDLAVADFNSGQVSILLGNGSGSFGAAAGFPTASGPRSVTVGNFNGDGFADLAVAAFNADQVSVLLGNGSGSFGTATNLSIGGGDEPMSVATGDFDDDGDLDLVTANKLSGDVSVLIGNGSGGFSLNTTVSTGGTWPHSVAVGDLDEDGDLDLAVANNQSDDVSVLLGNGEGSFAFDDLYSTGDFSGPLSVVIGEFDPDPVPDLAVASSGKDSVSVLFGRGAADFTLPSDYPVGSGPYALAAGDLDGDGASDLAVANELSNDVSVLLNRPDLAATPDALAFPTQPLGTLSPALTVTVSNTGGPGELEVTGISTIGADGTDFFVAADSCTGEAIPIAGTCQAGVRFAPGALGARTAALRIRHDGRESPLIVPLSGTGGALPPGPSGPTGPTGPTGPSGPQGAAGQNAKVTCVVRKKRKARVRVRCRVTYPSQSSSLVRWTLSRGPETVRRGKVRARNGTLRIPRASQLGAGRYVLRIDGVIRGRFFVS